LVEGMSQWQKDERQENDAALQIKGATVVN
jgi:hypothetical protein